MHFRLRRIKKNIGLILSASIVALGLVATGGFALAQTNSPQAGTCNGNAQPPNPSGHLEALLANLAPGNGSTVKVGSTVQFLYSDETPMAPSGSGVNSPTITIDGATVPMSAITITPTSGVTPNYLNPQNGGSEGTQCQDLISFKVPSIKGGSHTITATVYDGDGDHDTATWTYTTKPPTKPMISIVKQVCTVAAAKCNPSNNAQWASSHEIPSGSTAVWRVTVTNSGKVPLTDVTVTDPVAPGCAGEIASSLATGASAMTSCDTPNVTKEITNVATVHAKHAGASASASASATVTVIKHHKPSLITSQSLTPNDEGFVGQDGTGKMTFSLYPPGNAKCTGPATFTETVKVASGIGETTNTSFIATTPGTWRWLVTYSGNMGHKTSPCGSESFTIKNG
jgi:uncharacterized repeat protein (TIGR01451 family)